MLDVMSRVYRLTERALEVDAKLDGLMMDRETYHDFMRNLHPADMEPCLNGGGMMWNGMKLTVHHPRISPLFPGGDEITSKPVAIVNPTLLCLRAVCRDTGRVRYFDDPSTDKVFLPQAERTAYATFTT